MVDSIEFSRPKKNIGRDFADGVMMAELIYNYKPKIVELHNYSGASSVSKKASNWKTLNNKVLKKLGLSITSQEINEIINVTPNAIEEFLYRVFLKLEAPLEEAHINTNTRTNNIKRSITPQNFRQDNLSRNQEITPIKNKQKVVDNEESEEVTRLMDEIETAY